MALHTFHLDREFIELNVLLKLLAIASSGGAAKGFGKRQPGTRTTLGGAEKISR